jgi:nucleoid DNA-binding protein
MASCGKAPGRPAEAEEGGRPRQPDTEERVRKTRKLHIEGKGTMEIARALGVDGSTVTYYKRRLAERGELPQAALAVIQQEVAEGGTVSVAGWGKFESRLHKARTARNPAAGAEVKVPATRRVKFTPGSEFEWVVAGRPV